MSFDNSIVCKVCSGGDFELASGAFYCKLCGTESPEHGQDFVYEETDTSFTEPSKFGDDSDSNNENHWKNCYPDKNLLQSDIEESTDDEEEFVVLENLEKSDLMSDSKYQKFDFEIEEESQEEQAGS